MAAFANTTLLTPVHCLGIVKDEIAVFVSPLWMTDEPLAHMLETKPDVLLRRLHDCSTGSKRGLHVLGHSAFSVWYHLDA